MKNIIDFTTTKEIWFPSQSEGDVTTLIFTIERFKEYVEAFKRHWKEEPKFELSSEGEFSITFKITNESFVKDQQEYIERKTNIINKYYN